MTGTVNGSAAGSLVPVSKRAANALQRSRVAMSDGLAETSDQTRYEAVS